MNRLDELLFDMEEGSLTAANRDELMALLANADNRAHLVSHFHMNVMTGEHIAENSAIDIAFQKAKKKKTSVVYWPRRILALAASLLVAVGCYFALRLPPAIAVVAELRGDVQILSPGRSEQAVLGAKLRSGDELAGKTVNADALLVYLDSSRIRMQGDTTIKLVATDHGQRIQISRGVVAADIQHQKPGQPFMLTTPHAVATVVGTKFRFGLRKSTTRLEVAEGIVRLALPDGSGEVDVPAGSAAEVSADGKPVLVASGSFQEVVTEQLPEIGTYKPDSKTTGPRPGVILKRWDGNLTIDQPGQIVENLDIYGQILVKPSGSNAIVRNCIVRGPGGLAAWNKSWTAVIVSDSESLWNLTIEDSRIDCTGRENPYVDGIRSGNVTLRRVEIVATMDGISGVTIAGNVTCEGVWIHNGYYTEWIKGTPRWPNWTEARTYNDCIQLHRGKGYKFIGCRFGGKRNAGPRHKPPFNTVDAKMVAKKDSGDDYESTCVMIKQEVSAKEIDRLDDILFDKCWFEGGVCSVNLVYASGNPLRGLKISDCKFGRITWDTPTAKHYYVMKDDALKATLKNLTFEDTGLPVPITRGNN